MEHLQLKNVKKIYNISNKTITALNDFTYQFNFGKFYAITGSSGSGKSTLLKIMGLLLNFDKGEYSINNENITKLNEKQISEMRSQKIGFIYQDYFLDSNLKAFENIMLPMLINNSINRNERKSKSLELLKKVGLEDRMNHYPRELSGGEQQRVCIARALANNPDIILADEPTGNLDDENEKIIFSSLKKLSREGKCVIVVTHSENISKYADYILKLEKGKLL